MKVPAPTASPRRIPNLRKRFRGKPEYIIRYMLFVAEEVRRIMAQLGFRKFEEMVGRADRLCTQTGD